MVNIFEEGTRHFYEKEEISDWLLVHGLSEENSKIEAAMKYPIINSEELPSKADVNSLLKSLEG